jgi:hypothetical protein
VCNLPGIKPMWNYEEEETLLDRKEMVWPKKWDRQSLICGLLRGDWKREREPSAIYETFPNNQMQRRFPYEEVKCFCAICKTMRRENKIVLLGLLKVTDWGNIHRPTCIHICVYDEYIHVHYIHIYSICLYINMYIYSAYTFRPTCTCK